jgi:hypothetical protein
MVLQNQPGAERVLCIAADNNPLRGSYYSDPGAQDASLLSSPAYTPAYSYLAAARSVPVAASQPAFFDVGTAIPAATYATAGGDTSPTNPLRSFGGGYWSLPAVAPGLPGGGSCSFQGDVGSRVAFRVSQPLRTCTRSIPLSPEACASLSAAYYTSALLLGSSPQASPSTPASLVPVAVGSVFALLANGSLTLLDAAAGAAAAAATAFSVGADGSATCANALIGLSYRIAASDAASTITAAVAEVVLAPLTQPAASYQAGAAVSLPLATTVTFVPDAASAAAIATSLSSDNALPTDRSGYPGYLPGSAVLAGVMTTASGAPVSSASASDQKAVARSVPAFSAALLAAAASNATGVGTAFMGLQLRGSAADGACMALPAAPPFASASLFAVDPAQPVPVTFGEDAVVGCQLRLSQVQFAALCGGSPASVLPFIGLGSVDPTGTGLLQTLAGRLLPTHVGTIGAADPLKAWHWVPLAAPAAAPAAASYDATTGACRGVVAGVDVQFLTGSMGEAGNPQQRILAARYRYATDTWRWTREGGGSTNGTVLPSGASLAYAGDATQVFSLRSTVTWVSMDAQTQDFTPPAPPVVPPLPSDLFYPFVTTTSAADQQLTVSSGAGSAGLHVGAGLAAAVACGYLLMGLWNPSGE